VQLYTGIILVQLLPRTIAYLLYEIAGNARRAALDKLVTGCTQYYEGEEDEEEEGGGCQEQLLHSGPLGEGGNRGGGERTDTGGTERGLGERGCLRPNHRSRSSVQHTTWKSDGSESDGGG
jgi:hypothetical protein